MDLGSAQTQEYSMYTHTHAYCDQLFQDLKASILAHYNASFENPNQLRPSLMTGHVLYRYYSSTWG